MLDFSSKSLMIITEAQVKDMFEQTLKGATQHDGDGATISKLMTRINSLGMPFLLLGVPGKTYIVGNLREVAGIPPAQLIQMINQAKGQQPQVTPNTPIIK